MKWTLENSSRLGRGKWVLGNNFTLLFVSDSIYHISRRLKFTLSNDDLICNINVNIEMWPNTYLISLSTLSNKFVIEVLCEDFRVIVNTMLGNGCLQYVNFRITRKIWDLTSYCNKIVFRQKPILNDNFYRKNSLELFELWDKDIFFFPTFK